MVDRKLTEELSMAKALLMLNNVSLCMDLDEGAEDLSAADVVRLKGKFPSNPRLIQLLITLKQKQWRLNAGQTPPKHFGTQRVFFGMLRRRLGTGMSMWVVPVTATLLSDAISSGKPASFKRCLVAAASDINLRAISSSCHEDVQHFYCQRVRDVASKRYTEPLKTECLQGVEDSQLIFRSYSPARIAYVILAHQFPQNVKRLISRLLQPLETVFAVHVDEKNPGMLEELVHWTQVEALGYAVQVYSKYNIVRGGANMLHAQMEGIRQLLHHAMEWDFCILLSEQDYPLRGNEVLATYLWVHHGTSFVSVDEGECERDVSYQCGDRVISLSTGLQYPKIPGMRYASGSQWFAVTRGMASTVASSFSNASTLIGTIFRDLTAVKQPDESFFQAVVLNTQFCTSYSDFTLHWTDKDSMREVRSLTSEYSILSPGVLGNLKDFAKIEEVRQQSLWAFFARKFDDSPESSQLKDRLDAESSRQSRPKWIMASVPSVARVVEVLASSLAVVKSVKRLQRNHDGIFNLQTLQLQLEPGHEIQVREKLATPKLPHPLLALRVGCDWNKTELVFDGDVSAVSASSTGPHRCPSLWAVAHWRMSKKPISQEVVLVWIDPRGTPMQHAPISISEHSVLLWHRYTATQPLPQGQWSLEVRSNDHVIARRHFFAYGDPSDIPWRSVREYFDIVTY
ncbi:oxt [Symbiodinium sp. KB8]|nr:oxt [Symbiodinium sp. KB8]